MGSYCLPSKRLSISRPLAVLPSTSKDCKKYAMLATLGSLRSAPAKVSGVTSADAGTVGNTTLPMLKVTLSPST